MCNFVKDRTNLGRGWGNGENEGTEEKQLLRGGGGVCVCCLSSLFFSHALRCAFLPLATSSGPSFYSLMFPHPSILFFISLNEINIKNKYNIHKYVY